MIDVASINSLEDLTPFLNEKGVMEIVIRQRNKRIADFQKATIGNLAKAQESAELVERVAGRLSDITRLGERSLDLLGNVAMLEGVDLLLNGLNLCATCAGFAVMYRKLDSMSEQIAERIDQLGATVRQGRDLQNDFEFNKVLATHTDMLDREKTGRPYSEERIRELVDQEYSVLKLLLKTFEMDASEDNQALIFSSFSLLSMLTASIRAFDECYYYNNHANISDADVWHSSHANWMTVYDTMTSEGFVEKLQDYGSFETQMSTFEVDAYYTSLVSQVSDLREEVQDNQRLIVAMGDADRFERYKELSAKDVADTIEAAFREAGAGMDEHAVTAAYENAMRQAAML